jgi:hypothetical protein
MNPSMPTDQEIARELRGALRAEAERIAPEPALQRILARAHEGDRARTDRSRTERRRRWLPALAGAVATAGIAAAAIVIFAPSDEPTGPAQPPPCAVEVREGCPVDLAVYFSRSSGNELVSAGVTVTSSGNVGLDAVQALLDAKSKGGFANLWQGYATAQERPIAQVNDVTHAGGVITTDFDRQLTTGLANLEGDGTGFGRTPLQQLVLTVQSALRTDDPVLITVNGEPADEAFGERLTGPVDGEPERISFIRPESPTQGEVVASPVAITGESQTFEGNVRWSITQDGEIVRQGFTTGGGFDAYAPFSFKATLPPGEYTLKLWEPNAASGAEAWTDEYYVAYLDFTVE